MLAVCALVNSAPSFRAFSVMLAQHVSGQALRVIPNFSGVRADSDSDSVGELGIS